MRKNFLSAMAVLALLLLCGMPTRAQEMNQKSPIYTYVSEWSIPRAQWPEMEKQQAPTATLDKLVADGTLIGYGFFTTAAHEPHGPTHGDWISGTSLGSLFKALDAMRAAGGGAAAPIFAASEWHRDYVMVSRTYNAHSGSFTNGMLRVIQVDVKPGEEDSWNDTVQRYIVPLYEQLLANGTLHSYQVDFQWNHTDTTGRRYVVVIASSADALDKVTAAAGEMFSKNPAIGAALLSSSVTDSRRDYLAYVTAMKHK
jgi:hypothetical protein